MTTTRTLVLCLLAAAGCSSTSMRPAQDPISAPVHAMPAVALVPADVPAPAPKQPTPPPAVPTPGPQDNMTGGREHAMSNCPSMVPGARTQLAFTDDGVELTITASAPKAVQKIRELARRQAAMSEPSGNASELHTGKHGGPGAIGYCPIIHHGHTIVTTTDVANGARIRIRGHDADSVLEVQELAALRAASLPPVMPINPPGQPATK